MKKPTDIRENVAAGIRRNDIRDAAKRLLEELPTLAGDAPIENVTRTILEDLVALVRERHVGELDEAGRLLPTSLVVDDVVRTFQAIRRNDETRFEHHQARKWDGKEPTSPASRWLEPREMAIAALKALGAKVPDPIAEALGRDA
jgi:hypothetical protein